MGHDIFTCSFASLPLKQWFALQLNLYKWRSDPKYNQHISRVTFKDANLQLKEQTYLQFLKQQQHKEYINLNKLKSELMILSLRDDNTIITFQKYDGDLTKMNQLLVLPQMLYTFHCLLSGFQQIATNYEKIVINLKCCFVTNQGNVRAWININYKNNIVMKDQQFYLIKSHHNTRFIINQLIKMMINLSEKHNVFISTFFNTLQKYINLSLLKHFSYSSIRQYINQYAYKNNIQISHNLLKALKRQKDNLQLLQTNSSKQKTHNIHINRQSSDKRMSKKDNIDSNKFEVKLMQVKKGVNVKEVELKNHMIQKIIVKGIRHSTLTRQSHYHLFADRRYNLFNINSENHSNCSQIIYRKRDFITNYHFVHPGRFSEIIVGNNHRPHQARQTQGKQLKHLVVKQSKDNNANTEYVSELRRNNEEVFKERQINNNHNSFINNKLTNQNKLSLKNSYIKVTINEFKDNQSSSNISVENCKTEMNAIIVSNIQGSEPQIIRKECIKRAQKYNNIRKQGEQNKMQQSSLSNSCITVKTITRLIKQNESSKQSLKQSFGQSSDYYNDSVYSGILTQMGREAVLKITSTSNI